MSNQNGVSSFALIARGWLIVNIPVFIIILGIWYALLNIFNLNYILSLFIGTLLGWYYWAFSIKRWIKWARNNKVEEKTILKMGRLGLLLWNNSTITDTIENDS